MKTTKDRERDTTPRKVGVLHVVSDADCSFICRHLSLHDLAIPPDLAGGASNKLIQIDIKGEIVS